MLKFKSEQISISRFEVTTGFKKAWVVKHTGIEGDIQPMGDTQLNGDFLKDTYKCFIDNSSITLVLVGDKIISLENSRVYEVKSVNFWEGNGVLPDSFELIIVEIIN